ncbi:MAG: hypothetical protein AABO58_20820 [Acidobacteriota bacterium]
MLSDLALVVAVLLACVWVARGTRWMAAIECSLPLLAVAIVVFPDERTRLFACGAIVAVAFAGAALVAREGWVLVIAGVALLRWIPLREVEAWRELVVLAGALVLFGVRASRLYSPSVSPGDEGGRAGRPADAGGTPALHLIAVFAVAAVTPVHPGKAALIPLLLAAVMMWDRLQPVLAAALLATVPFARWSLVPILVTAAFALLIPYIGKLRPLVYAAALALFAMWPWSGIVARALPVVARFEPPTGTVRVVGWALGRGEEATLAIPHARHVIVNASAASGSGLPAGTLLGTIDAGTCTRSVRIGDVADFGFTRRPHFFAARNPLPRITRGDIRGYGATAWLHGAGAIGVACSGDFASLRFRAAATLPPGARLQIESVELPAR